MNKISLLVEGRHLRFHSTFDIIEAVEWMKELVWQNVKNVVKNIFMLERGNVETF